MNDQREQNSRDDVIRLTREEAMGEHVEDLLRRQKNMRGEPGITLPRKAPLYYQNWFIFGLAGILAALIAWGFIEPYFDDFLYVQGRIENMDLDEPLSAHTPFGVEFVQPGISVMGWIQVRGERIWLLNNTGAIIDGETKRLWPDLLEVGDEVGAYVEYLDLSGREGLALAHFIDFGPPASPPAKASESFASQSTRNTAFGFLVFSILAGAIGMAVGAAEGLVCRLPKRAVFAGLIGLLVGLVGGLVSTIPANVLYDFMSTMAMKKMDSTGEGFTSMGFMFQIFGRSTAWALSGMAAGLGQGLALRSKRLVLYGFLGGLIGGLLGGLLFDPIDFFIFGHDRPSAHWSRLIGFVMIGLSVGVMIGVVELMARDMWLRMVEGPLAGKEFLFYKDTMSIGSSPQSALYLFNDPLVKEHHATLYALGDGCEIESRHQDHPVLINDMPVWRTTVRHGDRITIGRTSFVFHKKRG